ncbi:Response regulator, GGDEF domain protein [Alkalibacterium sp. AK22]|uniref:GGDEF domain-containing protein n=1 Tax=Alkalibacterium sp. AK22 TaxID=1229520 RepID=UPI000447B4A4|nr:GGDEF domain-containing protein [Alkalibacterium sp. AK22]EXJ23456.1 Response regulator, GGDEF domain protein [Alkalibacterium sp. AK22]
MSSLLEDLVINVSLVISLIFIFMHFRWRNDESRLPGWSKMLLDGLSGGIMGVILMRFSIELAGETIADFRHLPIILMVLFVGRRQALISTALIGAGRFLYSVDTMAYVALAAVAVLYIGLVSIDALMKDHSGLAIKSSVMILYATFLYTVVFIFRVQWLTLYYPLYVVYWIVSLSGGLFAVFFMNYIRATEYLLRKYQIEASVDYLTGLKNVRTFNQTFSQLKRQIGPERKELSLIMIDIDHFKSINDRYGHAAGDFILIELAGLLQSAFGKQAHVFRKGGEEFVVLLADKTLEETWVLTEACRAKVEQHAFGINDQTEIYTSISAGISQYPLTVAELDQLMPLADKKLYRAKQKGRNVVC